MGDFRSAIVSLSDIRSPLVRGGFEYWLRKCGTEAMPARSDIDPPIEVPHLCGAIILQEIRRDPLDFRYRLVGSAVRSHLGGDRTGCWMSGLEFQKSPNPIWFAHAEVATSGHPIFLKPPYVGPYREFLEVEGVILPLGEDRRTPDRLILFVDFPRRAPRYHIASSTPEVTADQRPRTDESAALFSGTGG